MSDEYPSAQRIAGGLIGGALVAAAPALIFGPMAVIALPIALVVTFAHALVLALPAYLVLRRYVNLTYGSATIAGYFIGTLPLTILIVLNPQDYGASNLFDLFRDVAGILILAGLLGAAAGATFRGIVGSDDEPLASE